MAWDSVPAIHTAGGLLCMWNNSAFEVERKVKGTNFLMLAGKWIKEDMKMSIVNVYAPCDNAGKRELWNQLKQLKDSNPEDNSAFGILYAIYVQSSPNSRNAAL